MRKQAKHLSIILAAIFGIIMFMLAGGYLYLNTSHGQKHIQTLLSKQMPGSMIWDNGRLSLLKGEIEIRNAIIKDPGNDNIAGFDRLFFEFSWFSFFKGGLTVKSCLVEKPWTKLRVDTTGELNLLQTFVPAIHGDRQREEKKPAKTTPSKPIDINIEKFNLSQGSLHFETADRNTVIVLQEIDLAAQADLLNLSGKFVLHIRSAKIDRPEIHTVIDESIVEATLSNGRIDPLIALIQSPSARLKLSGSVTDIFNRPSINAMLDCTALLHEIRQNLNLKPTLTGEAAAHLQIKGSLDNPDANLHLDYMGGTILDNIIDRINLDLRLNDRVATIDTLKIEAAGGILTGQGNVDLRQAFQKGFLSPERDLQTLAYDLSFEEKGIHLDKIRRNAQNWKGIVHSSLTLHGTGVSSQNINAKASLAIDGKQISAQQLVTPVDLRVKSDIDINRGTATVRMLNVRADASELNADGSYDISTGSINGKLSLVAPDIARTISPFGVNDIDGMIALKATVSGSTERPLFTLDLQGKRLRYQDITFGDIRTKAELVNSGILNISQCTVDNGSSTLQITGNVTMYDHTTMKPIRNPEIIINVEGETIRLEDFVKNMTGTVSLVSHLEGTIRQPRGTVKLQGNDFNLYGQKLAKINLTAAVDGTKIRFEPLQIFVTSTESIRSSGWISFQKEYDLNLVSRGISLHNIEKIRTQDIADGLVLFDISGHGTFANPILTGNLSVNNVRIKGKEIEDFHVTMDLHDHVARFKGKLNFDLNGQFDLKKNDFSLTALFNETDLSPYWKIAGRPDLSGKLTGTIKASGNAQSLKTITGDITVSVLDLFYKETKIVHADNLIASFKNEELSITDSILIFPPAGRIVLSGTGKRDGTTSIRLDGTVPLDVARYFDENIQDITGSLSISSTINGSVRRPEISADIELKNVGFTIPTLMQKLHNLDGRIKIRPEGIVLEKIKGYIDKGSFDIAGRVRLRKGYRLENISVKVGAVALPIHIPDTLDMLINSQLQIEGTREKSTVNGNIILLEGTYYKDINLSLLRGIGQKKREEAPPRQEITHPFLKNMYLDISIRQSNPFLIDNNLATLEINPDLRVVGTANDPIIRGRATVASGTVRYQGKTFVVNKGIIDFINPYKIDPEFDIRSEVTVREWLIALEVSGTRDQLNFKLTSDPPEEHGDILSLLLLGKTTRELIAREGGTTQSTEQMLAGLIASTFGEDIKESTGLDIFEVETSGNSTDNSSGRIKVTVGKEMSKRLTIKDSVESKEGEITHRAVAEYKLLENFLARGFQDSRGVYGGELQFRLEFR